MRLLPLLLVLAALVPLGPAAAAGDPPSLLLWVADGPPLGVVLRTIGQRYPGRALTARVIERDGRSVYRIKWLGDDGTVRDITADARTGEILHVH